MRCPDLSKAYEKYIQNEALLHTKKQYTAHCNYWCVRQVATYMNMCTYASTTNIMLHTTHTHYKHPAVTVDAAEMHVIFQRKWHVRIFPKFRESKHGAQVTTNTTPKAVHTHTHTHTHTVTRNLHFCQLL